MLYLGYVIECERALALGVEVSSVFQGIVWTYQDLYLPSDTEFVRLVVEKGRHAFLELPGSLTVVNCSSLYFLKAGLADSSRLRSSEVKALISMFCECS